MIPSKSPYSRGWSSTSTASRLSARLGDGPLGTAHDLSTPSISSRRSQCSRRAACIWTTNRPPGAGAAGAARAPGSGVRSSDRSEEHTSELQSRGHLVCRLLLEKKKEKKKHKQ